VFFQIQKCNIETITYGFVYKRRFLKMPATPLTDQTIHNFERKIKSIYRSSASGKLT
jgi:hypothetical protein